LDVDQTLEEGIRVFRVDNFLDLLGLHLWRVLVVRLGDQRNEELHLGFFNKVPCDFLQLVTHINEVKVIRLLEDLGVLYYECV
jgi:hypothetical protein